MAWYVNRTGQPEGPYEDDAIVQWIGTGGLGQARICAVGGTEWVELGSHPPFAQALGAQAGGAAPQAGYGAAPQQGGYGAAPQQGGYGAAQASPGYPQQPQGYGAPPQGFAPQGGQAQRPPSSKKGLLIGLVVGAVVLLVGAGLAAFFLLGGASPKLATTVPSNIQVYMELPSIKRTMLAAASMDIIDASKLDPDKTSDDVVAGIAGAFEVSKEDAKDLAWALDSWGVAARDVTANRPQIAMLLAFGSAGPVEKLLASSRFKASGAVGKTGKKYTVEERKLDRDKRKLLPPVERALSGLDTGSQEVLVWFEGEKVLALGTEALLGDMAGVIEDGKDSLEKSALYEKAKADFESGAAIVAFGDLDVLPLVQGGALKEIADGYFKGVGPVVASMKVESAGVLLDVRGRLAGSKLPDAKLVSAPTKLDLAERLPSETIGYMAFSTKTSVTGKEAQAALEKQLTEADKGGLLATGFRQGVSSMEESFGLSLQRIYDALGDQAVISFAVERSYKYDPKSMKEPFAHFGSSYVQHVKDKAAAAEIVAKLNEKVFGGMLSSAFKVTKEGGGFAAEPAAGGPPGKLPWVRVDLVDDLLFIGAGNKNLTDRAYAAFKEKKDTIAADKAHERARSAVGGDAHMFLWVDGGRIIDLGLQANPGFEADAQREGFSPRALRSTGDDRVTVALSAGVTVKDGVWTYRIQSLNALTAVPLLGAVGAARRGGFDDDGPSGDKGAESGESIGVAACDEYLRKMTACVEKMPASARQSMRDGLETSRNAWKGMPVAARPSLKTACEAMLKSVAQMPYCQ